MHSCNVRGNPTSFSFIMLLRSMISELKTNDGCGLRSRTCSEPLSELSPEHRAERDLLLWLTCPEVLAGLVETSHAQAIQESFCRWQEAGCPYLPEWQE